MRILVVEDDFSIRESLQQALELEGHQVETAPDGARALEMLNQSSSLPELILLDLMMPKMDGRSFLDHVSGIEKFSSIPVGLLTATREQHGLSEKYRCLKKPVDLDQLLDFVQSAVAEA